MTDKPAVRPLPPHADAFLTTHTGKDGSPRTFLSYRTALGSFWEHRATLPDPTGYASDTLVRFFQFLDEDDCAPDTKRLYLGVVTRFLDYLEADGLLTLSSVAAMERAKRVKIGRKRMAKRRRHASPWVYVAIETAILEAKQLPPADLHEDRRKRLRLIALRDAAIVCTLLSTGARVSELIGLTRGAVKQGKAQTAQVTGKGDKRRMVILDDESQRTIQAYLRLRQDTNPALFVSHLNGRRPKGLDAKSVQRVMEHLEESIRKRFPDNPDAQAVRITPHIFRHNVGASLTREGAHPNSIKAYLGHASVQTTEVYQEDAADEQVMDDVATYTPTRRQQIEDAKELLNLNVPENA